MNTEPKTGRNLSLDELRARLTLQCQVTLEFTALLHGGTPKSPDVIDAWIRSRVDDEHQIDTLANQAKEDMGASARLSDEEVNKIAEAAWNGFRRNDQGLFLMGYQVKALLKEAASVLKGVLDTTALKSRVAERMFVVEEHIPILREGLPVQEPDGTQEKYIHVITPQGPKNALNRTDYIEAGCQVRFTVRLLREPYLTKTDKRRIAPQDLLALLLEYGQNLGLGANRSQGFGTYRVVECQLE